MNIKNISVFLFYLIGIEGCATTLNSGDIEQHYKNYIGKRYNPHLTRGGWRVINEDAETLEVENFSYEPKCTWSLTVDKKTNLYIDFKFTSDRESCDKIKFFP